MYNCEWVVYKDNKVWINFIACEEDCIEHIKESSKEFNINENRFSYRKMTEDEINEYF